MRRYGYTLISGACRGYTLIELLVVITITGLIFSIGYISFRDFSRRQLVNSVTRGIIADLKLAQEDALSGRKPAGCTGDLNGYKFQVDTSANSYTVSAFCTNGNGNFEVKSVVISSDLAVTAPSTNPVIFKPIGIGTNIPDGTSVTILVNHKFANYSQIISIGSGGQIQ